MRIESIMSVYLIDHVAKTFSQCLIFKVSKLIIKKTSIVFQTAKTSAVSRRRSIKNVFLKVSQNSRNRPCTGILLSIKLKIGNSCLFCQQLVVLRKPTNLQTAASHDKYRGYIFPFPNGFLKI